MKKAAFLILLILVSSIPGCKQPQRNSEETSVQQWLDEMTIRELQEGYREGRYTVTKVVSAYIDRINAIDKSGPALNSIISINPDALRIAAYQDSILSSGTMQGALFGIPVVLKDNIDSRDAMPTTGGSLALKDSFIETDSHLAARLREAGSVIIAKANLSEWANFRSGSSSSGWSAAGGQTRNPYVTDRNPCGSSSGSGVAVSANLCMVAIGTETDGSIVCPSNNNGIVGIKPTVGLISRRGIIPISFTQDTPGPMARTVTDAAICLGTMTGRDSEDEKTMNPEAVFYSDYTKFLTSDGLKNKKIGVLRNSASYSEPVNILFQNAIKTMENEGAIIIEVDPPPRRDYGNASFQVLLYEFKDGLNKYLGRPENKTSIKSLSDLIRFNNSNPEELRYFGQEIFLEADQKGDLNSPEYREALTAMHKATRNNGIDKLMNEHDLDMLIAPTGSPAWKTDLVLGDHFIGGSSSLAAIAGYPAITVPMGMIHQLPVGITFFGKAWSEPVLIETAYAFE